MVVVGACFLFHRFTPLFIIRGALTISVTLKACLLFVLPFLILSSLALAFASLPQGGLFLALFVMGMAIISNFLNLVASGFIGKLIILTSSKADLLPVVLDNPCIISPFFKVVFPQLISNTTALIIGISFGIGHTFYAMPKLLKVIQLLHSWTMGFMKQFFIPLLPFFIAGFLLKLFSEGQLTSFIQGNVRPCLLMFGFLFFYLWLWLMLAKIIKNVPALGILRTIFPAMVIAFSTMSSAAALPFSLKAASENTQNPLLANTVMPITLNLHMLGDTICIPIMAMIILNSFHCPIPDGSSFMLFGVFFILNKFAGAGIPGGTIMVSLPVLQRYLGFNTEMLALITAFYVIIDPITTIGNVTANNLFIVYLQKLLNIGTALRSKLKFFSIKNPFRVSAMKEFEQE